MRKILTLLLAATLCLSLAACGNAYAKYDALIDCLEKGDYVGAYDEIDNIRANANKESETDKKTVTVEITTENWQQYFKIEERFRTVKNDFDEIEDVYKTAYLVLKEGYELAEQESTRIAVEYDYVKKWHYVTIDKQAETMTVGEAVEDHTPIDMSGSMVTVTTKETPLTQSREYSTGMQAVPMDFEIVRMKGTLYITE